jgi:uncharacterized protein (TIGR03000 family)
MPCTILAVVAVLLLPLAASAQKGKSGIGGGFKPPAPPVTPSLPALMPNKPGMGGGISGGFGHPGPRPPQRHPGYPFYGIWPGYTGGYPAYYPPVYYPIEVPVPVEVPVYVPVGPPEPRVELSGQLPAILVLQFPAAAQVTINGKKSEGDPQTEWTLTSPPVNVGAPFAFEIKARWTASGKTFEYAKTVSVAGGDRTRSLVLTGTEVKE